ncbi:DUF6401 family natural product biosynthesis protein [Nocardia sp. XZ_19_385]|uniref:DUF6401 family natural product biosynthesis protein n=1 Tax=Nocardia sp. XZ_19_385 TaxID=2769488 RepID=UPI00188EE018|nr:DUF6401 family natural product biosynthesis protein [Nocardia sp. XZ_19_385]
MFMLGPALLEVSARRIMNRLHDSHGEPALTAAAENPALSAVLDQHGAAIRDILDHGVEDSADVPPLLLLAGYVRGLLDQAREHQPATAQDLAEMIATPMTGLPPADWTEADWMQLRLAAVCVQAQYIS